MSVRTWTEFGLAIAVCAVAGQLALAEDGRPSRQALEQMGLGSLAVMSDDEALSVRGQGFHSSAMAFGNSFATFNGEGGGSHSQDAYAASGNHFANGHSFSFAGVLHIGGDDKKNGGSGKCGRSDLGGGNWGGMNGGSWGGMGGGNWGGDNCHRNCGGGKSSIHATVLFAGGSSSAFAF